MAPLFTSHVTVSITASATRSHCLLLLQRPETIGRASLARENETGGSWGQEVHILYVNI